MFSKLVRGIFYPEEIGGDLGRKVKVWMAVTQAKVKIWFVQLIFCPKIVCTALDGSEIHRCCTAVQICDGLRSSRALLENVRQSKPHPP